VGILLLHSLLLKYALRLTSLVHHASDGV
jgi:hypothetical protein